MFIHITLNLLNKEKTVKVEVKHKRNIAGWNNAYLEKVLAGIDILSFYCPHYYEKSQLNLIRSNSDFLVK